MTQVPQRAGASRTAVAPPSRSPVRFFALVFALTVPFWILGSASGRRLMPGLPVSALAVVCPALAAAILVRREKGTAGVTALLRRSFDHARITPKLWYAPILLLVPGVTVLAYWILRWQGRELPDPRFSGPAALALFIAFFAAALAEELGWSGYALDALQERWSALESGVLLGLVWAAWHGVALVQVGRPPDWIAWWVLYTVAGRVLLTWIYDAAGKSVFAAALHHAVSNVCWQLFPDRGSHWDPRVVGILLALVAAIVTIGWGPRTLAGRGTR